MDQATPAKASREQSNDAGPSHEWRDAEEVSEDYGARALFSNEMKLTRPLRPVQSGPFFKMRISNRCSVSQTVSITVTGMRSVESMKWTLGITGLAAWNPLRNSCVHRTWPASRLEDRVTRKKKANQNDRIA